MPSEYSFVHGQPNYWRVRFDDWNGWEAPHMHASQGGRELQVYTQTLAIKNQTGRFTVDEVNEIKMIASSYANRYCLSVDGELFNTNEIESKTLTLIKMVDNEEKRESYVK